MRKWFNLCVEHGEDLAKLLTMEQGKPLAEARGEIGYSNGFLEWFAEEARRIYGEVVLLLTLKKLPNPTSFFVGSSGTHQRKGIGANSSACGRGCDDYPVELSCCHDH